MSDQVAEEIKVQEWIQGIKWVLIAFVAIGVVGLGYWGLSRAAEAKNEKAFALLFQAERLEQEAVKAADPAQAQTPEAQALAMGYVFDAVKKWPAEKQKDYLGRLAAVHATYPGTLPAALALLRQGNLYYHLGQLAEAQNAFQECASSYKGRKGDVVFRAMAYDGLGAVLEAQTQWDAALKAHREGSELTDNPLKPLALLGMARVQRAQGKVDEAKPLYEKVIKDFPNSEYEKRARVLLTLPTGV